MEFLLKDKQQQKNLKVTKTMVTKQKIIRAIERSNLAYKLYLEDKKYYLAKRIYKSNLKLYNLLEEFLYNEEFGNVEEVLLFLFHLEDWFEQFKTLELSLGDTLNLESEFVFNRLKHSPKFPSHFLNKYLIQ